ncbi:hypothetical protein ACFQZS_11790 [Mucilaginibacter calamicampi]|uniref:Chain length determinant protein n=1 Tax=Mucilaginibacter calamicampi TaxID=1302352 RepID=A0ABW2Z229_9SPHI
MSGTDQPSAFEREFSIKELFNDKYRDIKYLLQFRALIVACIIGGAVLGALAAYLKKPTYTARLTFVIDDAKSSGSMGGLSSLAGQFGFNLDGLGGASGVLAGDNIEELVKSQKLIQNTLVSAYDDTQTLADRYAAAYKLDKEWLEHSPDGKIIRFPLNGKNNTRLQDSLLHEITELILDKGQFGISKPDKKLGFFEINVTFKDEKLAMLFCRRIIKQSTDFFITTKTKRLKNNADRLQVRADSLERLLNSKTYAMSNTARVGLDLNPAFAEEEARLDIKQRDKIVLSTIYSETVKNLEASRSMLAQETPTVQIVDEPELPLKKNRLKYPVAIAAGIIILLLLFATYKLMVRKPSESESYA